MRTKMIVLIVIAGIVIGLSGSVFINSNYKATQRDFETKLAQNWEIVASVAIGSLLLTRLPTPTGKFQMP